MCDIPQLPCCVTYSIPNSASNLSNIHEVVYEVPDYTATIAVGRCCYLYGKPLGPFVWEGARANCRPFIRNRKSCHKFPQTGKFVNPRGLPKFQK